MRARFRSKILVRSALALAAAMLVPPRAAAEPVEYLPAEHWAYDDLLSLWNHAVLDSLNVASLPWSRTEIARALQRVPESERGVLFRRLEWQFAKELARLGHDGPAETPPLLSLREGESEVRLTLGVDGRVAGTPPDDAQFEPGSGAVLRGQAYFRPHVYVGADLRAQRTGSDRSIGDSLIKDEDFYLDTGETYVSFAPSGFEFLFGLTETRWGPGRAGTLLISDAAAPFATLRARKKFGRVQLDALHGTLVQSDHRHVAMHRLSLALTPGLTVGVAEAARYDAESPELLYLLNLIPYTVVERFSDKNRETTPAIVQRNNVMMSADVVWRFRRNARIWAEFLMDDLATETDDMPHRLAWQAGAAVSGSLGSVPAEVLFEHTKVFRFTYAVSYDRDYIFAGDPLGFVHGPDVEQYVLRLKADPSAKWSAALEAELLRRGEGFLGESWDSSTPLEPWSGLDLTGVVESTVRIIPSVAWIPRDNVWLRAGAGLRHAENAGHARGETETEAEAFLELLVRK